MQCALPSKGDEELLRSKRIGMEPRQNGNNHAPPANRPIASLLLADLIRLWAAGAARSASCSANRSTNSMPDLERSRPSTRTSSGHRHEGREMPVLPPVGWSLLGSSGRSGGCAQRFIAQLARLGRHSDSCFGSRMARPRPCGPTRSSGPGSARPGMLPPGLQALLLPFEEATGPARGPPRPHRNREPQQGQQR